MDKKTQITFEQLNDEDISDKTTEQLANKYYWKNDHFNQIYFKRTKQFSFDENETKKEFENWHKEIGNYLYNKETNEFNLKYFKTSELRTANSKIIEFLKYHPNLTIRDEKNIILVKQELTNKFLKYSVMNTFLGLFVILAYNRTLANTQKITLAKSIKRNYFISVGVFFISFLFLDIRFKLKRPFYLVDYINQKGMIERYFKNYL